MHQIIVEEISLSPSNEGSNADSDAFCAWFSRLQHLPGATLLHSGNTKHNNARFHIASAMPVVTLSLDVLGRVALSFPGLHSFASEKDAEQLKGRVKGLVEAQPEASQFCQLIAEVQTMLFGDAGCKVSGLPFSVGCMGYASYDYGRFLEVLPENTQNDYRNPIFSVGFYTWSMVKDIADNRVFMQFCDRFNKPEFAALSESSETTNTANFALNSDWQSNMSKEEYVAKLTRIHEYLLSGDCYQVNLAQRFSAGYEGSEWQAWLKLLSANQAPFSAFIRGEHICILSCSPERFLSVTEGKIETKPIKGTRPRFSEKQRDEESREELINSEKDRAENLMIVDLLRNDISKNSTPHSVVVKDLFDIESFSAVHHMVSTVQAEMSPDSTPLKVFRDAFPGGSITGAPKIRAMEIIDELEPHRRNIYCGSIFYFDANGNFDSNIGIRTLLFEQNRVHCWAGGGIVADSDAEMEYLETYHKVDKILPVLNNN